MNAPTKLYVRDGSRYVELSPTLLTDCPPIPVPQRLEDEDPHGPGHDWDEHGHRTDPDNPARTLCYAPTCPHGHFRFCKHCTTPLERTGR